MAEEQVVTDDGQAEGELGPVTFEDGVETPIKGEEIEAGKVDDPPDPKTKDDGTPINQEAVNKRINQITFQKHEERRKREATELKLKEANDRLAELQKTPETVVIPPLPDAFEDDYEAKIAIRDAAIKKQAEITAETNLAHQQQQDALLAQTEASQKEIQDLATGMYTKGIELGVKEDDLKGYDEKVALFIQDRELAKFILGLDESPLVVKYLAQNPTALEQISTMNPLAAAGHIATKVVPEASKLKPDLTKTPDPLDIPGKKGAPPKQSEYLDGVTME